MSYIVCRRHPWAPANFSWFTESAFSARIWKRFLWGVTNTTPEDQRRELTGCSAVWTRGINHYHLNRGRNRTWHIFKDAHFWVITQSNMCLRFLILKYFKMHFCHKCFCRMVVTEMILLCSNIFQDTQTWNSKSVLFAKLCF